MRLEKPLETSSFSTVVAHQYFAFRGRHEVQLDGRDQARQADIERGRAAIRPSLQVAS